MFTNKELGDIFLISGATSTIHTASGLSDKCAVSGDENGSFGILPCSSQEERALMLAQFAEEYGQLKLCPHCFAEDIADAMKRREEAGN